MRSGDVAIDLGSGVPGGSVLLTQEQFTQDRQESVMNIQRTIADLGNIFTQLATMVANQGETIERSRVVRAISLFRPQPVMRHGSRSWAGGLMA